MVPMPAIVVLILCKTVIAGEPDINSKWTGYENRAWDTTHSMMTCRRQEVQLYDPAEAMGADPVPFTVNQCQRAGVMLGAQWDVSHRSSSYRYWRTACPVPIIDTRTGETIAWSLPDCGKRGKVICERDTAI